MSWMERGFANNCCLESANIVPSHASLPLAQTEAELDMGFLEILLGTSAAPGQSRVCLQL